VQPKKKGFSLLDQNHQSVVAAYSLKHMQLTPFWKEKKHVFSNLFCGTKRHELWCGVRTCPDSHPKFCSTFCCSHMHRCKYIVIIPYECKFADSQFFGHGNILQVIIKILITSCCKCLRELNPLFNNYFHILTRVCCSPLTTSLRAGAPPGAEVYPHLSLLHAVYFIFRRSSKFYNLLRM
jgi:hypothetical protein